MTSGLVSDLVGNRCMADRYVCRGEWLYRKDSDPVLYFFFIRNRRQRHSSGRSVRNRRMAGRREIPVRGWWGRCSGMGRRISILITGLEKHRWQRLLQKNLTGHCTWKALPEENGKSLMRISGSCFPVMWKETILRHFLLHITVCDGLEGQIESLRFLADGERADAGDSDGYRPGSPDLWQSPEEQRQICESKSG